MVEASVGISYRIDCVHSDPSRPGFVVRGAKSIAHFVVGVVSVVAEAQGRGGFVPAKIARGRVQGAVLIVEVLDVVGAACHFQSDRKCALIHRFPQIIVLLGLHQVHPSPAHVELISLIAEVDEVGRIAGVLGRVWILFPTISPMPRNVITMESAFCEAIILSSNSISGTIRNMVDSESAPVTAAAVTWRWYRRCSVEPRTSKAAAWRSFGSGPNAARLMRTTVLLRRWPIRLRPMRGVAKDSSARRVDSIVLEARTTAQLEPTGRNFCCPFT